MGRKSGRGCDVVVAERGSGGGRKEQRLRP